MNVVITGVTGFRNRGVEALVRTKIDQMLINDSELKFTILTNTPNYDCERLSHRSVEFIQDSFQTFPGQIVQKAGPIKAILKKMDVEGRGRTTVTI